MKLIGKLKLKHKKDTFKEFRKKFKITRLKAEAGRVVICERLLTHGKIASDTMLKSPRNLKKVGTK